MKILSVNYSFHPVGQGLFASGSLHIWRRPSQGFNWVYDCGSTSAKKLVADAIDRIVVWNRSSASAKPRIDLVVISHFDHDHISGLVTLLSKFSVGALLLPYMPLWQRVATAFAEGVGSQQGLFQFFVNPVAYVRGIDGGQIGQIILVPPSGEDGPPDGGEGGGPGPEGEGSWKLDVDTSPPIGDEQKRDYDAFQAPAGMTGPQVQFMRDGGALRAANVWEFVPYNDAALGSKVTAAFRKKITSLQDRLLDPSTKHGRSGALANIKKQYDKTFGKSSQSRNKISLFLYGGPRRGGRALQPSIRSQHPPHGLWPWHPHWDYWFWHYGRPVSGDVQKLSILYTGDGYLDTKAKTDRLLKYLGETSRAKQICALQVMHHGAKSNWHRGIAARFDPNLSIFSSDPKHKMFGHPHAPVLKDFLRYSPMQVDKRSGCYVQAVIELR